MVRAEQCEKLGQTIIFVRTRETARALHAEVRPGAATARAYPLRSDRGSGAYTALLPAGTRLLPVHGTVTEVRACPACALPRLCPAQMEKEGHKCTSIEGGMDKQARDKVVREFRCDRKEERKKEYALGRGLREPVG